MSSSAIAGTAFNALDRNHDGVITRAEFQGMMPQPVTYAQPTAYAQPATYAAPQPAYAAPQPAYAAPQPAYAAPRTMTYAAPQVTYAASQPAAYAAVPQPVTYPAPVAAPMQYATAPIMQLSAAPAYTQQSAFDAVDRNHDGVITRNELASTMAPQPVYAQAPAPAYTASYNPYQLQTAQSMVAYTSLPQAGSMVAYPNAAPTVVSDAAAGAASSTHAGTTLASKPDAAHKPADASLKTSRKSAKKVSKKKTGKKGCC